MLHYTSLNVLQLDAAWATIGTFDGVHRGHQAVIRQLVEGAHAAGAAAVAVTFFPHPAMVVRNRRGPIYLTTPEERAVLLGELGVDVVLTLNFDAAMAAQSALEFMQPLAQHLGLKHLLVGHDFALGRNREGNVHRLTELGAQLGYAVSEIAPFQLEGSIVSSSQIRALISAGQVAQAAQFLSRPYTLTGQVIHGDGRGRGLGIPTANLDLWPERLVPAAGVYACWAWVGAQRLMAVTNVGVRPTFGEHLAVRIEPFLLDFDQDLYGQTLKLAFIELLRPEQRFASVQALLVQIDQDVTRSREILSHVP